MEHEYKQELELWNSARRAGVVEGLERAKVLYVTVPHDIQHHRAFTLGSKALRDSIDSELQRLREETPTTAPHAAGKGGSAPLDTAGQPGSSATSPAKGEDFEAVEKLPTHGTPTEEKFFERHARAAADLPMDSILVVGSRAFFGGCRAARLDTLRGLLDWAKAVGYGYSESKMSVVKKLRSEIEAVGKEAGDG